MGICGSVGSGKTSLISAILGQVTCFHWGGGVHCSWGRLIQDLWKPVASALTFDLLPPQMTLLEGSVAVNGDFAYVAQQAWILNASLRDNILFGKDYDEER